MANYDELDYDEDLTRDRNRLDTEDEDEDDDEDGGEWVGGYRRYGDSWREDFRSDC
jgi:hypothetical protein